MIIIQAAGGLGNQLQQYALYRKFISMRIDSRLDVSWFTEDSRQDGVYAKRRLELDYFENLNYKACTKEEKLALTGDGSFASKVKGKLFPAAKKVFIETDMYHPEIFEFKDKYLCGYFACEKYYADIMDSLRKEIVFPKTDNIKNIETADKMEKEESVSVHIRRGDYLDAENAAMFGNICTEAYYEGAVCEIKRHYPNAHFYLFSDDISYVRKKYRGEEYSIVDFNTGRDSFYDMWLMSRCRHNICANSTFSFWGARFNSSMGKIMIRPNIHKNTQVFDADRMHELWEGFTLIDRNGNIV